MCMEPDTVHCISTQGQPHIKATDSIRASVHDVQYTPMHAATTLTSKSSTFCFSSAGLLTLRRFGDSFKHVTQPLHCHSFQVRHVHATATRLMRCLLWHARASQQTRKCSVASKSWTITQKAKTSSQEKYH